MAFSAEQARHTENVFQIALRQKYKKSHLMFINHYREIERAEFRSCHSTRKKAYVAIE